MSTLKVNSIQNAAGVEVYTAKAWVNFNGAGTVAIRSAGNVSSITDHAVGEYTVNFTTALPSANYAAVFGCGGNPSYRGGYGSILDATSQPAGTYPNPTTTSVRIRAGVDYGTPSDSAYITAAFFA